MSRHCDLTGKGPMVGHKVSHSNIKTKRRFLPNLADIALQSDSLGQTFRLRVTNAALKPRFHSVRTGGELSSPRPASCAGCA